MVHAHGRARRAGDRRRRRTAASASTPSRRRAATSTGWRTSARGASRASCGGATSSRSGTAATETYVGIDAARGRRLGARPRRARHVVLLARCGRSRRSAGPSETPELRAFYPTDVLSTARDILFLWVARMVMMGLEFAGDVPFARRLRPLGHPGARRPADDASRSAPGSTRSTRSTRTAPTRCASACWRCPPRRTCATRAEKVQQGQALANKLFNASRFVLLDVERRDATPAPRARRRSRTAGSSRACSAARADVDARDRRLRLLPGRARRSTTSSTASCATGTWSSSRAASSTSRPARRDAAARAARDARARAPGDPVRDRGALVATCPAPRACWPRSAAPRRRRRAARRRGRARASARVIEAVQALRALARRRPASSPARLPGARSTAAATTPTAELVARLARLDARRATATADGASIADPRRRASSSAPATPSTPARPSASAPPSARALRGRDRARRGQARQRRLRRQGAARRSSRPSATSSTRLRAELEAL